MAEPAAKNKKVYFEDVADRSLRLIDGTLEDLEEVRAANKQRAEYLCEEKIDTAALSALEKTTRALTGLLGQLRQIAKDNAAKLGQIGPTERHQLMLDYFSSLSEIQMYSNLVDFKAIYDDRRRRHGEGEADVVTPGDPTSH